MKSYTDLEQSKRLTEILPIESADMFYDGVQDLYKENTYNIPMNGSSITVRIGHIITEKGIKANLLLPAWSLTALFGALPKFIGDYSKCLYYDVDGCYCGYMNDGDFIKETKASNPIDACVKMIEHLHELNLL